MIVVRVELWPMGVQAAARHLGTAVIANDKTGSLTEGNYDVVLGKFSEQDPMRIATVKSAAWKRGRVTGFQRVKHGPWDLLALSLNSIIGSRVRGGQS